MKKNQFPLLQLCVQCQQLTDECTCPARFERQKLIEKGRKEWAEKRARREGWRDDR